MYDVPDYLRCLRDQKERKKSPGVRRVITEVSQTMYLIMKMPQACFNNLLSVISTCYLFLTYVTLEIPLNYIYLHHISVVLIHVKH